MNLDGPALPLLLVGGVLLLIGLGVMLGARKNLARRRRILDTPTTKIAQAPASGLIEVDGVIAPSEQGAFQAPFSGRWAVWAKVSVEEHRGSGKNARWVTILSEVAERAFLVDDRSGEIARVMPEGANVILETQRVASSGTFQDAPPHLAGFLASRGISTQGWLFNKALRYQEQLLMPGDHLYAIGPCRRDASGQQGAFRDGPQGQLVLFAMPGDVRQELILTNKTEAQLVSSMLVPFIIGIVAAGLGGALAVGGLIAGFAG